MRTGWGLHFFSILCALASACLFFFPIRVVEAAGEFITTWKTDNPGITATNQINIPIGDGFSYNYNVGWGDGTYSSGITTSSTHTYVAPGTYTVSVTGTFPGIAFVLAGDREKILSVDQWGTNHWEFMGGSYFGCTNLQILAEDTPDLSGVNDLTYAFRSSGVNGGFEDWDVSSVYSFLGMFQDTNFNGAIGDWDLSSATNISALFYGNPVFNQDIGDWDVSNVTSMNSLFYGDAAFNQDLSAWDTSSVTDMAGMFYGATAFDQDISAWNIGQVTTMADLFGGGARLSIENYGRLLSSWSAQAVQPSVTFDAGLSVYCAATARARLTSPPNTWSISDGGHLCLSEVSPLPERVTIADATYSFRATDLVDAMNAAASGTYAMDAPGCRACTATLDPLRHTVTFTGLRVGDVLNFLIRFTGANQLRIGPSLVVEPPGGGAVGFVSVAPPVMSVSRDGTPLPLAFILNGGIPTTTQPKVSLELPVDPATVRGYVVSLDPTFEKDGVESLPAQVPPTYTLPSRPGTYRVYLKYYSLSGVPSAVLSRDIELLAPRPAGSTTVGFADCVVLGRLSLGSVGDRVRALQRILASQGSGIYPEAMVTGFFGPATRRAVIRFQERHAREVLAPFGLTRGTGIVLKATEAALCRVQAR